VNDQPVGIFDSGVGGLTVAHAIKQLLPEKASSILAIQLTCPMVINRLNQ
jgi:glutamate racemase